MNKKECDHKLSFIHLGITVKKRNIFQKIFFINQDFEDVYKLRCKNCNSILLTNKDKEQLIIDAKKFSTEIVNLGR